MLGAPLARVTLPSTDRPSPSFIARVERALQAIGCGETLPLPFRITLGGCVEDSAASCIASVGQVSGIAVLSSPGGRMLIAIPDIVVSGIAEFAFGGDGSDERANARGVTPIGRAYADRLVGLLAPAIASAIGQPASSIVFGANEPAEIIALHEPALAFGFGLSSGETPLGAIGVIIPLKVLAALETRSASGVGDASWGERLERSVAFARVEVRAVLARPVLSAQAVVDLRPGSVIPIATLSEVTLIAEGFRIASGVADGRDGRATVVINKMEFAA